MASPLVETKLFLPQPRADAVTRPRLTELLTEVAQPRSPWSPLQPASGRRRCSPGGSPQPCGQRGLAWLSLEEADSEPARFWTYLVTAVQRAVPGIGTARWLLSSTPHPTRSATPRSCGSGATTSSSSPRRAC